MADWRRGRNHSSRIRNLTIFNTLGALTPDPRYDVGTGPTRTVDWRTV